MFEHFSNELLFSGIYFFLTRLSSLFTYTYGLDIQRVIDRGPGANGKTLLGRNRMSPI